MATTSTVSCVVAWVLVWLVLVLVWQPRAPSHVWLLGCWSGWYWYWCGNHEHRLMCGCLGVGLVGIGIGVTSTSFVSCVTGWVWYGWVWYWCGNHGHRPLCGCLGTSGAQSLLVRGFLAEGLVGMGWWFLSVQLYASNSSQLNVNRWYVEVHTCVSYLSGYIWQWYIYSCMLTCANLCLTSVEHYMCVVGMYIFLFNPVCV